MLSVEEKLISQQDEWEGKRISKLLEDIVLWKCEKNMSQTTTIIYGVILMETIIWTLGKEPVDEKKMHVRKQMFQKMIWKWIESAKQGASSRINGIKSKSWMKHKWGNTERNKLKDLYWMILKLNC